MDRHDWAIIARGAGAIALVATVALLLVFLLGQIQGTLFGTFG